MYGYCSLGVSGRPSIPTLSLAPKGFGIQEGLRVDEVSGTDIFWVRKQDNTDVKSVVENDGGIYLVDMPCAWPPLLC